MKLSTPVILGTFLGIFSWVVLSLADFNADYFLWSNGGGDTTWLEFVMANNALLWENFAPLGLLIFLMPVVSLIMLSNAKKAAWFVLGISFLLFLTDVYQFFSFDGGDRTGCEGCFAVALLHLAFGVISFGFACVYLCIMFLIRASSSRNGDG